MVWTGAEPAAARPPLADARLLSAERASSSALRDWARAIAASIGARFSRLRAELHHSRAAKIRVAGGGAGGDAPDAQASALGLPYVSAPATQRLSHHGIQRITVEFSE